MQQLQATAGAATRAKLLVSAVTWLSTALVRVAASICSSLSDILHDAAAVGVCHYCSWSVEALFSSLAASSSGAVVEEPAGYA